MALYLIYAHAQYIVGVLILVAPKVVINTKFNYASYNKVVIVTASRYYYNARLLLFYHLFPENGNSLRLS